MNNKNLPEELISKYKNGTCTDEERAIVESWHIKDLAESTFAPSPQTISSVNVRMRGSVLNHAYSSSRKPVRLWPRIAVAASIILVLSAGLYFYLSPDRTTQFANLKSQNDIAPGGNKATLTLADGRKISLTDAKNGQLAEQSGIKVTKAADGQLIYTISDTDNPSPSPAYNTIETPIGGQYQVNLPDGSKVWLNAASSLRYPVRFTGNERRVEITGEAYFEVTHNKAMPFKVTNEGQTVEVLGTHFNVMAYRDEKAIKTTLLEGSVKVYAANAPSFLEKAGVRLVPGQQSQLTAANINVVKDVDLEEVVAWKNGYFKFNENLESVMIKVARWYNVEVVYEMKPDPKLAFGGEISRTRNLSAVLKIMEFTGKVHFKIEGRRIIVTK